MIGDPGAIPLSIHRSTSDEHRWPAKQGPDLRPLYSASSTDSMERRGLTCGQGSATSRSWRPHSAGAVENSGDGLGVGDDLEDTQAEAGDVEREDTGEELAKIGRGRRGRAGAAAVGRRAWGRLTRAGVAMAACSSFCSRWQHAAAEAQMSPAGVLTNNPRCNIHRRMSS